MKHNQLFWGVVLLLIGGLMLADQMGIRLPNGSPLMSLFWPVLLIGFGIWVLLGVFLRGEIKTETANIDLQGAREAGVHISHGVGEFHLHSGASANELLHGSFIGGLRHTNSRNGERLEVRMRPANDFIVFPPFGWREQLDWDVSFNSSVPTALDMNLGANKSVIDLKDMNITDIRLKAGASDTVLTLPARGRLNADFEVGAASLTIVVPEGVAIRAHASIGAGDFQVDRTRFPNRVSPDYETSPNAVEINVKGGAVSVKII
ncbi:MAG: DUF5668 domain-containing protein [Anaerolineales bacterium]|nr:DUF5668 domain-containing protein [Anaerolineales bacterium]